MRLRWSVAGLAAVALACGGGDGDGQFADRMAQEHENDDPVASEAAERQPAAPVDAMDVTYAIVGGEEVLGYLARPQEGGGGAPGIILIHEWWGLNDNIRSVARQLAGEGYLALAIDLYRGQVAGDRTLARELMQAAMQDVEAAEDNLRQARHFLATQQGAPRVGVVGWCFGGGWSLRAALLLGEQIDATVIYYGRLITDAAELQPLRSPVLGLFGEDDGGIPVDSVRQFESALQRAGREVSIQVYEGAGHAFANPSGTRYQALAAEDAWRRTLAFFDRHLRG